MSRKKRAIKKQQKASSPATKAKREKKAYYSSYQARDDWENKKGLREQRQLKKRESQGISTECHLMGWEKPTPEKCSGCRRKCSYNSL